MNGHQDKLHGAREVLLAANEDAARFYRGQLMAPTNTGPRSYLVGRGFGALLEETLFTVGYAPSGWTSLVKHLAEEGYSDATLLEAGLVCRTRRGNIVDRFRDRITFGIRNLDGDLVGFTARCRPDAPTTVPKYLNTPTTAIYSKGETPFGLGEQHDRLRGGAVPVLVEGPFDALAVYLSQQETKQSFAGLALCGTALSEQLVDRLARLNTYQVILAFDDDVAGTLATERAACALMATFTDVRATSRHGGGDPAETPARSGDSALHAQLRVAAPASASIVNARIDGWADRLDNAEAKVGCLREAAALLAKLRPTDAAHHTVLISKKLGLSAETVTRELTAATSPAPTGWATSHHKLPIRQTGRESAAPAIGHP